MQSKAHNQRGIIDLHCYSSFFHYFISAEFYYWSLVSKRMAFLLTRVYMILYESFFFFIVFTFLLTEKDQATLKDPHK